MSVEREPKFPALAPPSTIFGSGSSHPKFLGLRLHSSNRAKYDLCAYRLLPAAHNINFLSGGPQSGRESKSV